MTDTPEPVVPCSACEVGTASFLLPSGAPVCADCFLALGTPEIRPLHPDAAPS